MSDREELRVPGPTGTDDEAKLEYGRQLAIDSILAQACGDMAATEDGSAAAADVVRRPRSWRHALFAAAALLLVCLGVSYGFGLFGGSTGKGSGSNGETEVAQTSTQKDAQNEQPSPDRGVSDPALIGPTQDEPTKGKQAAAPHLKAGRDRALEDLAMMLDPRARTVTDKELSVLMARVQHENTKADSAGYTPDLRLLRRAASMRGNWSFDTDGKAVVPPRATKLPKGDVAGEGFDRIVENEFLRAKEHRLSTFSIDVDTAAYANVRNLLSRGTRPPVDAVRVEEMINYFDYHYPQPTGEHPFGIHVDVAAAPWAPRHRLVRIGLQARSSHARRPQANLVFLVDVSGSMQPDEKLPLLKRCMARMVGALRDDDRVAMVVYAGAAGLVLDSTAVGDEEKVFAALEKLRSGGSTNGGAGIELAYKVATRNFIEGGVNRVILASDGDFNVGVSDRASLIRMIEGKRKTGVFLSVLGFGRGNLKDSQMEQIANKGNGSYHYIDSLREGQRVLVERLGSTLVTVAKDVKIQVEFNPDKVAGYRLIGYENRLLAKQDFNDDTKDAGEIGSGHTVTALYEVIPSSVGFSPRPKVDTLRYEKKAKKPGDPEEGEDHKVVVERVSEELLFVKLRYKQPDGDKSTKVTLPVVDSGKSFAEASEDFRFAAGVAAFGMVLRGSQHRGLTNYESVLDMAGGALGQDEGGYRREFMELVRKAKSLHPELR